MVGALWGLAEAWPGIFQKLEVVFHWNSALIPRLGLGAATASPEGSWEWPHHSTWIEPRLPAPGSSGHHSVALGKPRPLPGILFSHLQKRHLNLLLPPSQAPIGEEGA